MINIKDIAKIESKRREVKKEIYTKIFEQFSRKIKQTVELGQKQLFLSVPSFLMGYPTFDRMRAKIYLMRQLERSGFQVTSTGDYELYVTWATGKSQHEKEKEKEEELDEFPTLMNLKKAANKYRHS